MTWEIFRNNQTDGRNSKTCDAGLWHSPQNVSFDSSQILAPRPGRTLAALKPTAADAVVSLHDFSFQHNSIRTENYSVDSKRLDRSFERLRSD